MGPAAERNRRMNTDGDLLRMCRFYHLSSLTWDAELNDATIAGSWLSYILECAFARAPTELPPHKGCRTQCYIDCLFSSLEPVEFFFRFLIGCGFQPRRGILYCLIFWFAESQELGLGFRDGFTWICLTSRLSTFPCAGSSHILQHRCW